MEVSVDLVLTYFLKYFTYHSGAINKYVSLVNCPFGYARHEHYLTGASP